MLVFARHLFCERRGHLLEYIYQIRVSGHLFCDSSSAEKPFANRTVGDNSNGQFSSVHTAQCIQVHMVIIMKILKNDA